MPIVGILLTALLSYLLGSFNFGVILSRKGSKGDVREHGSGNAGMTNVLRVYGRGMAALTALGDLLKGIAAVLIARYLIDPLFLSSKIIDLGYVAGLFVLLGHIFPVFFHFRGGKGVVTSLGILFILDPLVGLILLVVGLVIIFFTRIVSLASILCAMLLPILTLLRRLIQNQPWKLEVLFTLVIASIVLFVHRDNISRLKAGTENRLGSSKKGSKDERSTKNL